MDIFLIGDNQVSLTTEIPAAVPARGFLWLDATHDEVAANPEKWREAIECSTGTHVYDPHLTDTINLNQ
jgi:magnesium transporter